VAVNLTLTSNDEGDAEAPASQPHLRQTCPAPHTKHLRPWRRMTVVLQ